MLKSLSACVVAAVLACTAGAQAQQSTEDLAKAAQNPIADMISVPLQNNTNFQTGLYHRAADILNIQPVIPFKLNEDWNVVTRTIIPVMAMPTMSALPGYGAAFGLGDINPTAFLSPSHPDGLIWGVGPTMSVPSATDKILGSGKWSAGPAVVGLVMPGRWVIGALVNNMWSFAGDPQRRRVNQMTAQYFVNYNFPGGWYVTSSPIITANWAAQGRQWTVPFGGGFGRVFKVGDQPLNAQIGAYYNAIRPNDAAHWQLRAQLSFLFPTK